MNTKQNFILISGFNLNDSNRGTAALAYGSLSFLTKEGFLEDNDKVLVTWPFGNPFKSTNYIDREESISQGNRTYKITYRSIWKFEYFLLRHGINIPFTKSNKLLRKVKLVAAINGGDGFSDIYGTKIFNERLYDTYVAIKKNIPLIILPQTLGPFTNLINYTKAKQILSYAKQVYIRDNKFISNLNEIGIRYIETKDLSYYMLPEPFNIDIKDGAIGINISGLAYFNNFGPLAGQFTNYPLLITEIVRYFQDKNKYIYLISHSYDYERPCINNDDLIASREFYKNLKNKHNIFLVDRDLSSPQIKYLISKMAFFVGTRMHANFAAIYTNVPLFGLAYSYKFQGAFEANGIYGQTALINNIKESDISFILNKIDNIYKKQLNIK